MVEYASLLGIVYLSLDPSGENVSILGDDVSLLNGDVYLLGGESIGVKTATGHTTTSKAKQAKILITQ